MVAIPVQSPGQKLSGSDIIDLINYYAAQNPLPGVFNFKPNNFMRLRAALAATRKGTANTNIAFVGDSTTRGQGSGAGTAQALNGFPVMAQSYFASRTGLVCRGQSLWGSGNATLGSFDARVTLGGSWTGSGSSFGPGGPRLVATAAGTFLFAPTEAQFDTADLYYCNNATGSMTVNFNAGATLNTINTTAAFTVALQANVSTLGTNVVNIPWVSGTPSFIGLDCYNSAIKQVSFWNMGWLSSTTATWNLTDSKAWNSLTYFASGALPVHAAVVSLGINDWSAGGVAPSTYKANLIALVTALQTTADVIILTPFPSDSTVAPVDYQAAYTAACYEIAIATGAALIDTTMLFNGGRAAVTSFYSDTKHLSATGYADVGATVARVLSLAA